MDEKDFERIREQLPTPEEFARGLGEAFAEAEHKLKYGGKPPKDMGLYVLEEHTPVPIYDVLEWARAYEQSDKRRVANTTINDWNVSTVFLGIDNNPFGGEPPLLFETMIFSETEKIHAKLLNKTFRKSMDNYCRRYATWDEAVAGHEEACRMIREGAQ